MDRSDKPGTLVLATLTLCACAWLLGCPKPVPPQDVLDDADVRDEAPPETDDPGPLPPGPQTPCSPLRVQFDYDSAALGPIAQRALQENAECIDRQGYGRVLIEGHCCELGSTEYNLALGQRRADAVRRYLADLGVDPSVLKTISYGEEVPLEAGDDEVHWSRNRRAEFVCSE